MSTPDTTTAQIIAYAQAALTALIILFGLDVTDAQKGAAIALLSAALGAFHLYSDAKIRNGRAGVVAATQAATIAAMPPLALVADDLADGDDSKVPPNGDPGAPKLGA